MLASRLDPAPLPPAEVSPVPPARFAVVDLARGAALVAMAAYHTVWDLGFLRLTPDNYALTAPGRVAAHVIAGSFLVLVGLGLVLMNGGGIRPRPYLLRLLRIGGAALLITLATAFAFPDSFIFFGVLHCIAVSSVLALPFLRIPPLLVGLAALLVAAAPHLVASPLLDAPALRFLGLGVTLPRTNDYVPLFPWFGAVLAGLAAGRVLLPRLAGSRLASWRPAGIGRALAFAGRHSLAIYLLHQPVLLALLTGLVTLTGPHPRAGLDRFHADYTGNCVRTGGEAGACGRAARCTAEALRRENLWSGDGRAFTAAETVRAQALSEACYAQAEGAAPPP
ncbi:heparan-alpha-glucosaminide N-acetyltransferase [Methylobacterium segetis]|uniref:heparan-alpha-glucosaminide N-acetyltransferase n=1 Tax=Methylobacterium segetis TaxID=2488750 RepID=UPI00104D92A2|nr:heparan-alpha-glucosaminide N-acetyltransferase [Methylobacterium segetis]